MTTISTGLHVTRKKRKGGDRWYVYAYRGGPQILIKDGERPAITPDLLEKAYEQRRHRGPTDAFDNILNLYRESHEFASLSPTTQREYRIRLDQISNRFGRVPVRFFNGPDMREKIIEWRDELADKPRAADRAVGMLSTVLKWAMDRPNGIRENAAKEIRHLHKSNRADKIWEAKHWDAVADAPPQVRRVLLLGALTGLRQSDLLRLTWEQVQPTHIATVTQKTGGEAVIPMHPQLARFLMGPGTGPILRNSRAKPWTPSGFQASWRAAKPEGFDRKLHDLRGTFVTWLAIAGFSDAEISDVVGWTTQKVAAIRAKYVDRAKVAKARAERLAGGKFTG